MTRSALPTALLFVAACAAEDGDAQLLLPDEVVVAWEEAYDGEGDGLGALVPVDAMAYDGETGEPLVDVELVLWTEDGVAWPVPGDQVVVVDPDGCPDCDLLWDAGRDQFLQVISAVDTLSTRTDADGLARIYVYVDAFPATATDFDHLPVVVSMGQVEQTFTLVAR